MSNVDLGSSKSAKNGKAPKKEKMLFMNLPTTLMLMVVLSETGEKGEPFIQALKGSIKQSFTNKEIRKGAFKAYGVKTNRKMERLKEAEYHAIAKIFGEKIWG